MAIGRRQAIQHAILAGVSAPFIIPGAARAQAFPSRQIVWVVPSAPGGVLDVASRLVAQKMTERLGQTVVVDNRPAAGGTVGADMVLHQPQDGHYMFFGNFATFAIVPLLIPNISYDAVRDFQPVNGIGASHNLIMCSPGKPWRTLRDLVAHAKANPEKVTFGAGVGSGQHAAAALFAHVAGIKLTHVPYQNFAQQLNDVSAGRVDLSFDYPLSSLPYVRDGKLRALAMNGAARLEIAKDIPTAAEEGTPGAELYGWSGIYVPSAVPAPVVEHLRAATEWAMRTPEVVRLFDSTGTVPWPDYGPARMRRILAEEIPRMRELIGRTGPG
jgi:tripartite-type tricarboxylate transporter receptor subunit TctC